MQPVLLGTISALLLALTAACKPPFKEVNTYELDYAFAGCSKLENGHCKPQETAEITVRHATNEVFVTFEVKRLDEERPFVVERCEVYNVRERRTETSCRLKNFIAQKTDSPLPYSSQVEFAKRLEVGQYILKVSLESGGRVFMFWPDLKVEL